MGRFERDLWSLDWRAGNRSADKAGAGYSFHCQRGASTTARRVLLRSRGSRRFSHPRPFWRLRLLAGMARSEEGNLAVC